MQNTLSYLYSNKYTELVDINLYIKCEEIC